MIPDGTSQRMHIRRRGRMTRAQARALETHYDAYCRPVGEDRVDHDAWFTRRAPLAVEIGFGMGDALLGLAQQHPEWNCLGIEVYRPGIGRVLNRCHALALGNLRILEGDARLALRHGFAERSLERIHIFFPDPWPKARHHKRRLVEPGFARLLASRLRSGGRLLLATDWQEYADWMLAVLNAEPGLRNSMPDGGFSPAPPERPVTRFAARGGARGHDIRDLTFEAR